MQTCRTIVLAFFMLLMSGLTASCGKNLHSITLRTGVVNQTYQDSFIVEDSDWNWYDNTILQVTRGGLPPGIVITADGQLTGTPTAVGDFSFRVSAYTIDTGFWDSDDWWDDDDDVDVDSEWFTLFVTEASTNAACPNPGDKTYGEVDMCLGNIVVENLDSEETFTLDVNMQTDFDQGDDYNVKTIVFTVSYDANYFAPVTEQMNSSMLRETATRTQAGVTVDATAADSIIVTLNATVKNLHKSGRLMDLPFKAVADVPPGEYPFVITINDLDSDKVPALVEIDGNVSVTEGIYEEDEAETDTDAETSLTEAAAETEISGDETQEIE